MPSGWNVYYAVFLSAVVALLIPLLLGLISKMLSASGQREPRAVLKVDAAVAPPGRKINTRFFLGTNVALLLLTLALVLTPCVGTLRFHAEHGMALRGLISILSLTAFAALGLLYAAKKRDLDWLKSFPREDGK